MPVHSRSTRRPVITTSYDPDYVGDNLFGRWTAAVFMNGRRYIAVDSNEEAALALLLQMLNKTFSGFKFMRNTESEKHARPWTRFKPRT